MPACLSLECLWTLVEHASDLVVVLDADQRVVFMNRRASEVLGFSRQEVVGQPADLIFVAGQAGRIAGFAGCACGDSRRCTLLARRRDGVILPMAIDVRGVQLEGEARSSWALTVRANASALAGMQSRAQTEGLFRTLVENVEDYAITMIDLAGVILTWNRGAEHLTGLPVEEAIESAYADGFGPDDTALPARILAEAAQNGRCEIVASRRRADGSLFRAHCVVSPIRDGQGRLVGYSEVMRDLDRMPGCLHLGSDTKAPKASRAPDGGA